MYVVFAEHCEEFADLATDTAATLEIAFAQIVCKCGYAYHFELTQHGWQLVITDVERPGCSPEPILSTFKKAEDAKRDLIKQAVDGRLKGYVAMLRTTFEALRARAKLLHACGEDEAFIGHGAR